MTTTAASESATTAKPDRIRIEQQIDWARERVALGDESPELAAVLKTLEFCRENEALIRSIVPWFRRNPTVGALVQQLGAELFAIRDLAPPPMHTEHLEAAE